MVVVGFFNGSGSGFCSPFWVKMALFFTLNGGFWVELLPLMILAVVGGIAVVNLMFVGAGISYNFITYDDMCYKL